MPWYRNSLVVGPLVITCALAAIFGRFERLPLFDEVELASLDLRFQMRGTQAPRGDSVILLIDDKSLSELGRWPLPHQIHADAVKRLSEAGARMIAFDILFAEGEPDSLAVDRPMLREAVDALAPSAPDLSSRLQGRLEAPVGDRLFADAISSAGNVLLPYAFTFDNRPALTEMPDPLKRSAFRIVVGEPDDQGNRQSEPVGVVPPIALLADKSAFSGHVTVRFAEDGRARYGDPAIPFKDSYYPSLSVTAVRHLLNLPPEAVSLHIGEGLAFGDRFVPTDSQLRFMVNYLGPAQTFPTYSYSDLISGDLPPERFRDKLVLIGGTALGLHDSFATPFTSDLPGVERFANLVDNLMTGDVIRRDAATRLLDLVALIIGGLLAALATARLSGPVAAAAILALMFIWALVTYVAFVSGPLWLALIGPWTSILVNGIVVGVLRWRGEERQRGYERLHDHLTGLPNRQYLLEEVEEIIPRTSVALVHLGLDRFKAVNDGLGRAAGDSVVRETAERLAGAIGQSDMLARVTGDEFVVLARDGTAEHADSLAQRLLAVIANPVRVEGRTLTPSASAGTVYVSRGEAEAEQVLQWASAALVVAKRSGGGRSERFHEDIGAVARHRVALESELREALVDHGQLRLHYQPQFDLENGGLVGFEALVRWQHPERGMISPGVFIPLAEETGLIVDLGRWALSESCQQMADWLNRFEHCPPISVNVSSRQFRDDDLPKVVGSALGAHGLAGHRIKLEVTESIVMGDPDAAAEVLRRVAELGVGIAIDDFGTGHSSLAYLHQLPFDMLKIDRSFVTRMSVHEDGRAIVRMVVALARELNRSVCAEGIETAEQAALLQQMQVDIGQGFHLGRPMPGDDASDLVHAHQPGP